MINRLFNIMYNWFEIQGIELLIDDDSDYLYYYDDDLNFKMVCKYNYSTMSKLIQKYDMDKKAIIE